MNGFKNIDSSGLINLKESVWLLEFSSGSNLIDIYYNSEMGIFPSTIWDGYPDDEEKKKIINISLKLPKLDKSCLNNMNKQEIENICYEALKKWCIDNNIKYK